MTSCTGGTRTRMHAGRTCNPCSMRCCRTIIGQSSCAAYRNQGCKPRGGRRRRRGVRAHHSDTASDQRQGSRIAESTRCDAVLCDQRGAIRTVYRRCPVHGGASTPATPLILPGSNYHRGWLGPRCAGFDSPYGKPRASVAAASAPATTASSRRHLYRSRWPSPPQRGSVIGGSHFATTLCSEFCC
jgi:hypothetical protein